MEEVAAYLLILITWHPDHPGQFDVRRYPQIFTSMEECQAYGTEAVAKYEVYKEFFYGEQRVYRCIDGPSNEEFDQASEERKERKKREAENAARDKEEQQ
jgi:putative component of membrane protein insertase Oxa1/YidC/SpoIIIJ protein YidD